MSSPLLLSPLAWWTLNISSERARIKVNLRRRESTGDSVPGSVGPSPGRGSVSAHLPASASSCSVVETSSACNSFVLPLGPDSPLQSLLPHSTSSSSVLLQPFALSLFRMCSKKRRKCGDVYRGAECGNYYKETRMTGQPRHCASPR